MSTISVIGLGAMGSALARAFLGAGHVTTVWNRTPSRMQPLVALGANGATSVADAVQASPMVMISVNNYSITRSLLDTQDVTPHLSGRVVIQLSTGTPREAHESERWAVGCGAEYLDGKIMAYASSIGAKDTLILLSGAEATFHRCQLCLACLGGDLRYLGQSVGAPAAIDLAQHCYWVGSIVGVAYGAHLCQSENVGSDVFASMFDKGSLARYLAEVIHKETYAQSESNIKLWEGAIQRICGHAQDANLSREFPEFVSGVFRRAIAAGLGDEDIAAVIKVLRSKRSG